MKTSITPQEAIANAGTIAELARVLNVSRQVVQNWKKRGQVPPASVLKLMETRPEWFKQKGKKS